MRLSLLLFYLCLKIVGNLSGDPIHCPLIWRKVVVGEKVPHYAIRPGGSGVYVARAEIEGNFFGGFFKDDFVFVNNLNGVSLNVSDYDILTNPHECITEWIPWESFSSHPVEIEPGYNKYFGRAWESNQFVSGTVFSEKLYYTSIDGSSPKSTTKYDILRSYSNGLTLQSDSFVFDEDPFQPSKDFMGMDEIHNGANTYVRQIVTHKRRVKETSKIASGNFWGVAAKVSAKVSLEMGLTNSSGTAKMEAEISGQFSYQHSNSEELYNENEREIIITKEVLVAPFTSVQICSAVSVAEDFSAPYKARGVYTAPGLSSQEIITILNSIGKIGTPDGRGGAITEETGIFSGNLAVTTQFIVTPYDSAGGCNEIERKIKELKRDRKNKLLTSHQIDNRLQEIDDIIEKRNIYNVK